LLDSNAKGEVYPKASNGGSFQKWILEHVGNGEHNIRNVATGRYLDSSRDQRVYTLPYNGSNNQKWFFEENKVINVQTRFALDCNGARVYTKEKNWGNYQNWIW
jgi:hypothetical protein